MVNALYLVLLSLSLRTSGPAPPHGNPADVRHRRANSTDSLATRARLTQSISEFHLAWQRAWRESEKARTANAQSEGLVNRRSPFATCRPDAKPELLVTRKMSSGDSLEFGMYQHRLIRSRQTWYAVCPTWLMSTSVNNAGDESRSLDGALIPAWRKRIHALRAALLRQLDSAATRWPMDGWIAGFRTRFRIDQGDSFEALATAQSCRSDAWWCAALLGYTYARQDNTLLAERAYREMERLMTPAMRCQWDDVGELLAAVERKQYEGIGCAERLALNARFWWLADPYFRTAGNERWVEQNSRRVRIVLLKASAQDERYLWSEKSGGDALAELVARYGWPSYTAWLGDSADREQTLYLASHDSPRAAPYTTFEYTLDRVHSIPPWQTVLAPFNATESTWFLAKNNDDGLITTDWWPDEHFRPSRQLIQLRDPQTATLRRQSQIVLASAVQLRHPTLSAAASGSPARANNNRSILPIAFDVMLLASRAPDTVDSLEQVVGRSGSTVAVRGLIAPGPALVAIEASALGGLPLDARARFGVRPPLPLDSMKPREIALSDPVVLDLNDGKTDISVPGEILLEHMMGTTQLDAATRRIGLYWESYGISSTDTVTISIRITSDAVLSAARRLGIAVNFASNPNRSIEQRWTEPDAARGNRTLAGPVPVQMRAVVLNLSQLEPSPYLIEIRAETRDGRTAVSERRVVLTR